MASMYIGNCDKIAEVFKKKDLHFAWFETLHDLSDELATVRPYIILSKGSILQLIGSVEHHYGIFVIVEAVMSSRSGPPPLKVHDLSSFNHKEFFPEWTVRANTDTPVFLLSPCATYMKPYGPPKNSARFPHVCPIDKWPAYIGFSFIECSNPMCVRGGKK